jgi:hypothetical protein
MARGDGDSPDKIIVVQPDFVLHAPHIRQTTKAHSNKKEKPAG